MECYDKKKCLQNEQCVQKDKNILVSEAIVTVDNLKTKIIELSAENIDYSKIKLVLQILVQIVIPAIQNIIDMIGKAAKEKG